MAHHFRTATAFSLSNTHPLQKPSPMPDMRRMTLALKLKLTYPTFLIESYKA